MKIQLIAKVATVGEHPICERECQLQKLEYNLMGCEVVMDIPRNLRSFNNELFTLEYFLKVEPHPNKFISLSGMDVEQHIIPL